MELGGRKGDKRERWVRKREREMREGKGGIRE